MESLKNFLNSMGGYVLSAIFPAVILFALGSIVIHTLLRIVKLALDRSKLDKTAHKLIRSLLRTVLYVLLALIVASRLGIDVTGIVALASVLTLAISLSVQTALTNLIGGFTLLYTKPFAVGDFVEVASQSGTVQEVGLTYTKLATGDNKIISIPNSAVVSAEIVNYTVSGTRRVDITVSAAYSAPTDQVLEALYEAAKVQGALDTPAPFAAVNQYGDSAVEYILRVWCTCNDYWTTKYEINHRIRECFEKYGVEMTYPHIHVHLDQ